MFISSGTPVAGSSTAIIGTASADRVDKIVGYVRTDQAGNVHIDQSADGINWDIRNTTALTANTTVTFSQELYGSQVRISIQNTGSAQTFLRAFAKGSSAGDS